jgi:hypothetical protein
MSTAQLVVPLSSTTLADIANTSTMNMTINSRQHMPFIHRRLKNSISLNPLFLGLNVNAHIPNYALYGGNGLIARSNKA